MSRDPMETSPIFSASDVRTWYRGPHGFVKAVDGASVAVPPGGSIGLVGESGSGKTQLFLSLLGLTHGRPGLIGGKAVFQGKDLTLGLEQFVSVSDENGVEEVRKDVPGWARRHEKLVEDALGRIGILFQEPKNALVPYYTVRKHFRGVLKRQERWETEAEEALGRLGFFQPRRILDSLPGELSGGEAQRVMLALAMAENPSLLLADEPTTAVDAVSQWQILDEIGLISESSNLSLVVISHDLAVVFLLAREVSVMFKGRVVEELTAELLESLPDEELHPYSRELRESQRSRASGRALTPDGPRESDQPDHALRSSGCAYSQRCRLRPNLPGDLQGLCTHEVPPLQALDSKHSVACWGMVG